MKSSTERAQAAIAAIRSGKMVILVDDEDRENEGDLCFAAEHVTPEAINFMAKEGRGLICVTLTDEYIERLQLPMMVQDNQAALGTAFTVSIEARHGVTTGISAKDRATTIAAAIAVDAKPGDVVSPGHVFPLKARRGGVLVRTGQTEGSVDLSRLAGLRPCAVICEIMRDDGEMARMPDLEEFSERHGILIVTIADLIAYRLQREKIVREIADRTKVRPPILGPGELFDAHLFGTDVEDTEYLALVRGDVPAVAAAGEPVLVRVHSVDPVGDALGTRPELLGSLEAIDKAGVGVFLYVFNKSRMGLSRSYDRYLLGGKRPAATAADSDVLRDFGLGAQILAELGCNKIQLLSNTDRKIVGIEGFGIDVVSRVKVPVEQRSKARMAHGGS